MLIHYAAVEGRAANDKYDERSSVLEGAHVALSAGPPAGGVFTMQVRKPFQRLATASAALLLLSMSACSSDSDDKGGDKEGEKSNNFMILTYEGTDFLVDSTVRPAAQLQFDDSYHGTMIGGWTKGTDFGTMTARINVEAASAPAVEPGTYRLVHRDFRDRAGAPYVFLSFGGNSHEELPHDLYSRSGEVTLEKLRFDGSTLVEVAYSFSGVFSEQQEPPSEGEEDAPLFELSGRVQYGGK